MADTPATKPHSLAHWTTLLQQLQQEAIEEDLTETQLIMRAYQTIGPDEPDRLKLTDLLFEAVDQSSFFSEQMKLHFRNQTWENNQTLVTQALSEYMKKNGCVPNINTLADKAKLSRQTVAKHLKDFKLAPGYHLEQQQFQLLRAEVLGKLFSFAMDGNVKAAKIYLDATQPETLTSPSSSATNYIQVNNMKIDQVTFMNLPEGVQQQIGELIQVGIQQTVSATAEAST